MGGSKLTKQKVTQDLRTILFKNANNLLDDDQKVKGSTPPSEDDFDTAVENLTKKYFKEHYHYDYNGSDTQVPDPDKITGIPIQIADGLCSIDPESSLSVTEQINEYLDKKIFDQAKLPTWLQDKARDDLCTEGKALFDHGQDTILANDWSHVNYLKAYNSSNPEENSVTLNSELVYCNAKLTEKGVTSAFTIIYFIVVYYEVKAPLQIARQDLFKKLYDSANSLTGNAYPNLPSPTYQDLEKILKRHAESEFATSARFTYDGSNSNPTDLAQGGWIRGNDTGAIIQVSDSAAFGDVLQSAVLSGIDISQFPQNIQNSIQSDLNHEGQQLAGSDKGLSWTTLPFGKTYKPTDPEENPIKTTAVFVYCNAQLTENHATAYVTCAYYVGVYYEVTSPIQIARQNAFKELFANLNDLLGQKYTLPDQPDYSILNGMAKEYAQEKFQTYTGFSYDGTTTAPPDIASGFAPYGASVSVHAEGNDVVALDSSLETAVVADAGIANSPIKPEVLTSISNGVNKLFDISLDSSWQDKKLTSTAAWPEGSNLQLKIVEVFVYSNASVTSGGVTCTIKYIYYVGLFYPILELSW